MKYLLFIGGIFLFIGIADLPVMYYTLLRIITTLIAVIVIIVEHSNRFSFWNIILFGIAILFNPFIPVNINDPATWKIIDFICACLFMYKASTYGKTISI